MPPLSSFFYFILLTKWVDTAQTRIIRYQHLFSLSPPPVENVSSYEKEVNHTPILEFQVELLVHKFWIIFHQILMQIRFLCPKIKFHRLDGQN